MRPRSRAAVRRHPGKGITQMTIGKKLGFSFGALLVLTLGMGFAEWTSMGSLGAAFDETAKGTAVKLDRAEEIGKYIQQIVAANRGAQLAYINHDQENAESNRRAIE